MSKEKSDLSSEKENSTKHAESQSISDEEVEKMLERLHKMDTSLQDKVDQICSLSGMNQKELDRFIENPNNFSDEQWQRAQHREEILKKKLFKAIGVKAKEEIEKKKKKKATKGRRGKTLGVRKGWMQM